MNRKAFLVGLVAAALAPFSGAAAPAREAPAAGKAIPLPPMPEQEPTPLTLEQYAKANFARHEREVYEAIMLNAGTLTGIPAVAMGWNDTDVLIREQLQINRVLARRFEGATVYAEGCASMEARG
jgi:hypothetical protein